MFKKYSFIFFLSVMICILQQAIISRIVIFNYTFDGVFVFLICFALLSNEIDSLIIALFCGLIRDSFFPYIFGLNSILYLSSVFIIVQINRRIYKSTIIIPFFITILFTVYKGLIYFSYFFISSIKFDFIGKTLNTILFETIYNSIFSILIYNLVKKIVNLKIIQHEWKF